MSESATRSRTGKKRGPYRAWSLEDRKKHSQKLRGRKHSEETKKKIQESCRQAKLRQLGRIP